MSDVLDAYQSISPYVHRTPLLTSSLLNQWLGHSIVFKAECLQKVGAFKIRGALNALLRLKKNGCLPPHVVAFSSGNHAQGLAWAAFQLGVKATIVFPKNVSPLKMQATAAYGAEVVIMETRRQAEEKTRELAEAGAFLVHAYDDDDVIAGQGTACYEALLDMTEKPDAIFAPCGGGGLLSGSFLAKQLIHPSAKVFGAEPLVANDAARSFRQGSIYRFTDSPLTIADGARTLGVSPRTFGYLQQLDGFYEVNEDSIFYWTQWLTHLLKVMPEPTSALAMAAAHQWLQEQDSGKTVLVILSGGNVAPETSRKIWEKDYLSVLPRDL